MTIPAQEVSTQQPAGSVVFRRSIVRAFVYPLLLLALLIIIFIWQLGNVLRTNERVEHSNTVMTQESTILKLLVDMETGLRGYLLNGDALYLEPYQQAQSTFDAEFQHLQALITDNAEQTQNLNDAWADIVKWRQYAVDTLNKKASVNDGVDAATQLTGKQLMDSIRQRLTTFVNTENRLRDERIRITQSTSQFVIISVVIVGLIVGALLAVVTLRQLVGLSQSYEQALALSRNHSEELLTQREWLQGVLSSIGDGVIATDIHGTVTFINPVTRQLTGWSDEEAAGKSISKVYEVVHEVDQTPTAPQDVTQLSNDSKHLMTRKGDRIPIEDNLTYIKDGNGSPVGTVIVFRDISHRKMIEQKRAQLDAMLEQERQRFANIIETVPGIFWENQYDSAADRMKLVFISAYVEPVLGYTVDEALAQPDFWNKVFHPEDAQRARQEMAQIRMSGHPGVVSFRALHKDGQVVDIDAHMVAIMEDGKPVKSRGVMMDVSDRQRLMNAQTRYAAMLRRSNEQLQQFAYIASHDLQEPLRMVISYLQLLERRYSNALDSDAHEFITFAVDGASRMRELISGLLQFSRLDGDQDTEEPVSVQEILDRALTNLSVAITDSGAVITHDVLPQVQADSLQLMQLFQNLIGNAIKFRGQETPKIHIGVQKKNDEWQFSVKDNGIGIAPEYKDRIFAMFQRLHGRTEYAGTGIGLAICKKIVERHGGRIWVESAEGEGATFYFTLPVSPIDYLGMPTSTTRPHSY
ncbi:MAG: PAS domain S-box protein [Anaerolineaceae bacterium]|nr:PAS domain S-box protein [Anaerolineaceae bacterium]